MERFLFGLMVFCVLMMALCIYGCNAGLKQHREFREKCIAAGGIPHQPKYDWVCLDPSMVRKVRR